MSGTHIKLVTRPRMIVMIIACLATAAWKVVKKYYETGVIESGEVIISVITFFIGLATIIYVVRLANKPEE